MLKKKKFTIMSMILVLSMFFSLLMSTNVHGSESPTISAELLDEYSSLEAVGFRFPSGTMLYRGLTKLVRNSDGVAVFCIEPGVNALLDISYEIELEYEGIVLKGGAPSLGNPERTTLTKDMIEDASLIAYHGWERSAEKSSADYVATQILVWNRVWGTELLTSPNDSYIRNLMNEIMTKVNNHNSIPSLVGDNFNINTNTLSLDLGESVTLTDNNNIINSMSITNNTSNLTTSTEGNKLVLTANSNARNGELIFNKFSSIDSADSSLVYVDPNSGGQKFAYLTASQPISYKINVLVNTDGEFILKKVNENSENLSSVEFELLDSQGNVAKLKKINDSLYELDPNGNSSFVHIGPETRITKLPVGEYTIREISAPSGYVVDDRTHSISIGPGETSNLTLVNNKTTTEISKTDIAGNEIPGASMQVLDLDENLIDSWVSKEDETHIIRGLNRGQTYILRETLAPNGYVKSQDIEFTVNEDGIVTTVEMVNELTELRVSKVNSEGQFVTGAELAITDLEGNVIETWISTESEHVIRGLEVGKEYILVEVNAPLNYVQADDLKFTVNENTNNNIIELINDLTTTEISKIDIAGEEIPGANMEVLDLEGNLLDSWISEEGKTHVIRGLNRGQTYILRETLAPNGYVKSQDVEFTVNEDGTVSPVEMVNELTEIRVSKVNSEGLFVTGAELTITDLEGNVIETWISTELEHVIRGLEVGKEYILVEVNAPLNYVQADDLKFTVNENTSNNNIELINELTTTEISKIDIAGEEISGASMEVLDLEGNLIDSWISEEGKTQVIRGLNRGQTYILRETLAPNGYVKSQDIEFTVNEDGTVTAVEMVNELTEISVSKLDSEGLYLPGAELAITDLEGNVIETWTSIESEHVIRGLEVGKEYILVEVEAPLNYIVAEDLMFMVSEDSSENQLELVNDLTTTEISKTDIAGEEIPGASMEVLDLEGNLIDSWISEEDKTHVIRGLNRGQTYILRETLAPNGYVKSQDIEFTINEDGSVTTVKMVNELTELRVSKVDSEGEFLEGAELAITDLDGNIIETWISTDTEHIIRGLNVDTEYILLEIAAPDGYVLADEIEFIVSEDAKENVLTLTNDRTTITFNKISDSSKVLAGAKLELYDLEGNLIDTWTSTSEAHVVEGLVLGEDYILREVEAPEGYERANDLRFTFDKNNEIIELENTRIIQVLAAKTGESMVGPYLIGMILLTISALMIIFRRRFVKRLNS